MVPDLYAILGVTPQADAAQIKAAFRQLARTLHPDSATAPAAPERLAQVLDAWNVLHDPAKRAAYDRTRTRSASTTARAGLVAGPTVTRTRTGTAAPLGPHIRVGPPVRLRGGGSTT